jgi:DNA processing protein
MIVGEVRMPRQVDELNDAELALLLADGVGPATRRKLLNHFGSAEAAIDATISALREIDGIDRTLATALHDAMHAADPASEREAMTTHDAQLIVLGDSDYPPLLASIPDPPDALWVRGELDEKDRLAVGIVGSRRCTAYGREQAGRFGSMLAESGLTIVSGGALGVDGEAHRGALRAGGRTIAVLGCGLARCYPADHKQLFERIATSGGALVSEFPMMTEPLAGNFPRRNRIISGLSLGILVIEAAMRSGALITARLAVEEHGREVMALPGRVDSPSSAGCHKLIRDGGASLVCNHADVLSQLDSSGQLVRGALEAAGHTGAKQSTTLFDAALTNAQQRIVEVLIEADDVVLPDRIAAKTQLPMGQLMSELTLLQIRGRVHRDHRGVRLIKR